jgi:hypothetical protein
MNAARYQEIQDMRKPRTKRSEFRSHAKLPFRPMTRVNVPHNRRHDDAEPTWPEYLAMLAFSLTLMWGAWALAGWMLPMIWGAK